MESDLVLPLWSLVMLVLDVCEIVTLQVPDKVNEICHSSVGLQEPILQRQSCSL